MLSGEVRVFGVCAVGPRCRKTKPALWGMAMTHSGHCLDGKKNGNESPRPLFYICAGHDAGFLHDLARERAPIRQVPVCYNLCRIKGLRLEYFNFEKVYML